MAKKKYTWVAALALATTCGATTAAHADPDKVAYELSERCGERAEKVFSSPQNNNNPGSYFSTYESHYNAKLNGCFAVTWLFNHGLKLWALYDVNDNHLLAFTHCLQPTGTADPADACVRADVQNPPPAT